MNPKQTLTAHIRTYATAETYALVLPSNAVPAGTIIACAANGIVSVMGAPTFESSTQATLQLDNAPVGGAMMTTGPATSLFQTAQIAIKMVLDASWALRSPQAVAWMQNVLL